MKKNPTRYVRLLFAAALLAATLSPERAFSDLTGLCSDVCSSQSSCDQTCTEMFPFQSVTTTCGGYGLCQGSTRYEFEAEQPAEGYYDCWRSCSYLFGPGLQSCSYTHSGTRLYVYCIY